LIIVIIFFFVVVEINSSHSAALAGVLKEAVDLKCITADFF